MSVRMIRRGSIAWSSVAAVVLAYWNGPSIPFRREAEIGQPALRMGTRGNLAHFVWREFEIEYLDVLRQPLDARGARDRRDALLHKPAQADLRRRLAMDPSDSGERFVVPDAALRNRAVGDECKAALIAGRPHLGLVEIGVILDLIADERLRTQRRRLFDQRHREV